MNDALRILRRILTFAGLVAVVAWFLDSEHGADRRALWAGRLRALADSCRAERDRGYISTSDERLEAASGGQLRLAPETALRPAQDHP